jgi:hypothetical protein
MIFGASLLAVLGCAYFLLGLVFRRPENRLVAILTSMICLLGSLSMYTMQR